MPECSMCEACLARRRATDRARYQAGKASGALYGGADVEMKRRIARIASSKRRQARLDAGLCTRCGHRAPVDGATTCAPCRDRRQAAERRQYEARKSAGLCVKCAEPAFGGDSRCAVCATVDGERRDSLKKNAVAREKVCRPSRPLAVHRLRRPGLRRLPLPRVREALLRAVRPFSRDAGLSPELRRVSARDRGVSRACFDDEMEAVAWLAFEKLATDQVEVVRDANPLMSMAAWE